MSAIDKLDGEALAQFRDELTQALDEARGESPKEASSIEPVVASTPFILVDILEGLDREVHRLIPLSLVAVALIVFVALRRLGLASLAIMPVVLGLLGMAAAMNLLELDLDMFNLAALLFVIGIGVDDGVHLTVRWAQTRHRRADIVSVWFETGAAVLLTSLTTMIGFGSLLLTRHAGLRSMGLLAVVGIAAATAVALLVMPAILWLTRRR